MNFSMIRFILGHVIKIVGILMLLPCIVALIYLETVGYVYFTVAVVCIFLGMVLTMHRPKTNVFYLKEGCIATALSWVVISLLGCLPFWITGEIPSFTDALFETISGFTTTGASILTEIESLSHCALFWRSFTHWIGGMGVLVFLLAVFPMTGGSNINLMKAESPGPSVSKLVPRLRYSAQILYIIYFGLTFLEAVLLIIGKMSVFEAVTTAFGTAGTGGFAVKNDSIAGYSAYIQWVVTVFMILFGVNFNAYYFILFKKIKKCLQMEEVRWYLIIVLAATAIIFFNILDTSAGIFEALTDSAFQVASIMTTTGFTTVDFSMWPTVCQIVLVTLMFIGACAGSTGGGIKVSRIVILAKSVGCEITSYIHPNSVHKLKFDGKAVDSDEIRSVLVYLSAFIFIFAVSVLIVSLGCGDTVTAFTAVAATINNIGPGLGDVGPSGNFSAMSVLSKYVLMFDMLAGRLELFPLLLLFNPRVWKDYIDWNRPHGLLKRKSSK